MRPTYGLQNPSLCTLPRSMWVLPHGAPCTAPIAAPRRCFPVHRRLSKPGAPRAPPSGRVRTARHAHSRPVAPVPKNAPRFQLRRQSRVQMKRKSRVKRRPH